MSAAAIPSWREQLPASWDVPQLWTQCQLFADYGANIPAADYVPAGVRFLRTSDITDFGQLRADGAVYVAESEVGLPELRDGDVLFSRSGTLGRSFLYNQELHGPATYAGYLVRYRPKGRLSSRFVYYFSKSREFEHWLRCNAIESTIGNVSGQKFSSLRLPVPRLPTQHAIADFLDRETEKIDTLIEKKERLLELLDEKRTALITQAVTKGLDPDVPMKDSGVEWLGEIPEHWEVVRLKRTVAKVFDFRGLTPKKLDYDWGGDIPAISAINLKNGGVDLDRGVNFGDDELYRRWMGRSGDLARGDVLFTTEAPMGNVALVPDDKRYILSQRVVGLRPREEMLRSRFMFEFLRSEAFQRGAQLDATGSTAEGISRSKLEAMPLAVPPVDEQGKISRLVEERTEGIARVHSSTRTAISLLREYRTALISAAVTGQIDVTTQASA